MKNIIPVFVGYDPREAVAYHTCVNSIIRNSSQPVAIVPVALNLFRDYAETHTDGSNHFIYTRFLVPHLRHRHDVLLPKGFFLQLCGDHIGLEVVF